MTEPNKPLLDLNEACKQFKAYLMNEENENVKNFAILYSPYSCELARINSDGSIANHANPQLDLTDVYEARLFNKNAELRWWHESEGKGRCEILTDELLKQQAKGKHAGTHEQEYLLWGKSVGASSNGWTKFAEARVGHFWVPVDGVTAEKQGARFTAKEYLREYQDGNVQVHDERLTGIELYPLTKGAK
jgi:CRISPR-associated protein (TIGR03984 family)